MEGGGSAWPRKRRKEKEKERKGGERKRKKKEKEKKMGKYFMPGIFFLIPISLTIKFSNWSPNLNQDQIF